MDKEELMTLVADALKELGVSTEPKEEPEVELKAEQEVEPKEEPEVELKAEQEVEPKAEPEEVPKEEPKAEPEEAPKEEPNVEQEAEQKAEPEEAPKEEPEAEQEAEQEVEGDTKGSLKSLDEVLANISNDLESDEMSEAEQQLIEFILLNYERLETKTNILLNQGD